MQKGRAEAPPFLFAAIPVMSENTRRSFLRGRFSERGGPLRPPWSLLESAFLNVCTRCGDCVRACPTHILVARDGAYPGVDFTQGECTFCGDCVSHCANGALQRIEGRAPWSARAAIGEQCLARQKVECRICGEQCEAGAIRFPPQLGGIAQPVLNQDRCTGCGACLAPCPTQAIAITPST